MRGRAVAGKDDMGGVAASRLTTGGGGVNGAALGAAGGTETHTLTTAQIPSHTHTMSSKVADRGSAGTAGSSMPAEGSGPSEAANVLTSSAIGSGSSHPITQPTIVLNYIIKT